MTETDYAGGNLDVVRVQKDVASQTWRMYLGKRIYEGGFATALPVTMEKRDAGGSMELAAAITPEAAQQLFDDLWQDGLRPSTYQRDVSDEVAWLRNQLGLIIAKEWK